MHGEKYLLKENKWKEFSAKNTILSAPLSVTMRNSVGKAESYYSYNANNGPAALLYEWSIYINLFIQYYDLWKTMGAQHHMLWLLWAY